MVDNNQLIINDLKKYLDLDLISEQLFILKVSRHLNYNIDLVYKYIGDLCTIEYIANITDSYLLLQNSSKIDEELSQLLDDEEFLNLNKTILVDLAKIYFYCDSLKFEDGRVVILKEVENNSDKTVNKPIVNSDPKIDVNKAISMTLKKIKYSRLDNDSIEKIKQLSNYNSYQELHDLLLKAIEFENRIKQLDDDCNMSIVELKEYLE